MKKGIIASMFAVCAAVVLFAQIKQGYSKKGEYVYKVTVSCKYCGMSESYREAADYKAAAAQFGSDDFRREHRKTKCSYDGSSGFHIDEIEYLGENK